MKSWKFWVLIGLLITTGVGAAVVYALPCSKTLDRTPPQIQGLAWEPTRIVNDKIYDIAVEFNASDDKSPIASATLVFKPVDYRDRFIGQYGMRPEDYYIVFPNDTRAIQLTPVDGEFDEKQEEFVAPIQNITGGVEYRIIAFVKDSAGNERMVEIKTPYIRQYENIAPLDDKIVIADYYTWYSPTSWRGESGPLHVYMPLLGEYDSADPIVIAKHIDWLTGIGKVDGVAVSWHGPTPTDRYPTATPNFEDAFLENPLIKDIKFFILYENTDRLRIQNPNDPPEEWIQNLDDPFNRNRLISDFVYLTNYFSHPSYLKISGRVPVIFDYTACFRGDIKGVFNELRERVRENGYELYLLNDLAMRAYHPEEIVNDSHPHILQIIESMDAISYGMPECYLCYDPEEPYREWHDVAIKYGKDYVPYSMPGFEPSPNVLPDAQPVPRDPEIFRMLLDLSIKYTTCDMIGIKAFNEWYWGHQIEPSKKEGFIYLQIVRDVISNEDPQ